MKKDVNNIISVQVEKEKNFFEDFTTLRWVKWTTRQPDWSGSVYIRWNSKYTSLGLVHNGFLMKLADEDTRTDYNVLKSGKISFKYTKHQRAMLEEMYWLEEKHDHEGYKAYRENMIMKDIKHIGKT
jgi:hypothetical protein